MGDFSERIDLLAERVGSGYCVGKVTVDQRYAKFIHEDLTLNHPRGGGPKYLEGPLLSGREAFFSEVARTALDDGGVAGMIKAVDSLAGVDGASGIATAAPIEFGKLHSSGHPAVFSPSASPLGDGVPKYDRPPRTARLTEEQLRAEDRTLPFSGALIGWIWRHHRRGGA